VFRESEVVLEGTPPPGGVAGQLQLGERPIVERVLEHVDQRGLEAKVAGAAGLERAEQQVALGLCHRNRDDLTAHR
jgi:hypothetical protein